LQQPDKEGARSFVVGSLQTGGPAGGGKHGDQGFGE
jgi:hypothetical protein